jgi:hypothetical protein
MFGAARAGNEPIHCALAPFFRRLGRVVVGRRGAYKGDQGGPEQIRRTRDWLLGLLGGAAA